MDEWDREAVTILTADYAEAQLAWSHMDAMAQWLEEDPGVHFNEMLDFIEGRMEFLDQENGKEDEDNDF